MAKINPHSSDENLEIYDAMGWDPHEKAVDTQIARLRDCIKLGLWRYREAQFIFAGLALPIISTPFTNRLEFLPGDNPLKHIPENYDPVNDLNYKAELDSMMRIIECVIYGEPKTPLGWLRIAKKAGLQIYWLDAALGDEECCQLLFATTNPAAIDKMLEINSSQTSKDFQSAGGKAKNVKSDQYKALCILVRTFDEQYALDPNFDQARLSEKMKVHLATGPGAVCADSSIARWMTEIRASLLSHEGGDRIKCIRAAMYNGHQSASSLLAEL